MSTTESTLREVSRKLASIDRTLKMIESTLSGKNIGLRAFTEPAVTWYHPGPVPGGFAPDAPHGSGGPEWDAAVARGASLPSRSDDPVEDVAVGEAASGVCGCGAEHSGTSSQAGLATFQGL